MYRLNTFHDHESVGSLETTLAVVFPFPQYISHYILDAQIPLLYTNIQLQYVEYCRSEHPDPSLLSSVLFLPGPFCNSFLQYQINIVSLFLTIHKSSTVRESHFNVNRWKIALPRRSAAFHEIYLIFSQIFFKFHCISL